MAQDGTTARRATHERDGRKPSLGPAVGVSIGLTILALAALLQVVLVVVSLGVSGLSPTPGTGQVLAYLLMPFGVLAVLALPLVGGRWPVSPGRAFALGLLWLVVALGSPLWIGLGFAPLASTLLAAPAALLGALCGCVAGPVGRRAQARRTRAAGSAGTSPLEP